MYVEKKHKAATEGFKTFYNSLAVKVVYTRYT